MSDKPENEPMAILPLTGGNLSTKPSTLVLRGLEEIANIPVTPEQIAKARLERKEFRGLSDTDIRIALEKKNSWQPSLYYQVVSDEIEGYESLRQIYDEGIANFTENEAGGIELVAWTVRFSKQIVALTESLGELMKNANIEHGIDKEEYNEANLIRLARRMGYAYKQFVEMAIRYKTMKIYPVWNDLQEVTVEKGITHTNLQINIQTDVSYLEASQYIQKIPSLDELKVIMADNAYKASEQLRVLYHDALTTLRAAIVAPRTGEKISIVFTPIYINFDAISAELDRIRAALSQG